MANIQIEYVDVKTILQHPDVPNIRSDIKPEEIRELIESIISDGVRVPINCFREGDKVFLINGWRRKTAVEQILKADPNSPVRNMPVVFVEYGTENRIADALCDNLVDNVHRQDVSPYDMAQRLKKLADMGMDYQSICKKINKSITWVRDTLSLLDLEKKAQESLQTGEISTSEAKQIAKLEPKKQKSVTKELVSAKQKKDIKKARQIRQETKEANRLRSHEGPQKMDIKNKFRELNDLIVAMKEAGADKKEENNFLIFSGAHQALSWVLGIRKEMNVEKHLRHYLDLPAKSKSSKK